MKTWEMVKALSENQNAKFKNGMSNIVKISDITKTVVWVDEDGDESPFIIYSNEPAVDNLHIEWESVRQEVDFMTAINSGKNIKPSGLYNDFMGVSYWLNTYVLFLGVINGKWLIE